MPARTISLAYVWRLFQARNSRHTYATEMLRVGVSVPVFMRLLGHANPEMTMRYLDVALTDLQREFQLTRSKPGHLVPGQAHRPLVFDPAATASSIPWWWALNVSWRCSAERCRAALPEGAWIGSPTASPKSEANRLKAL